MVNTIVIVLDVLSALFLIITILLHSGRGSGLSDMFGGGGGLSGGTAMERTLDRITVATRSCSASARSGSRGAGTPDRGSLEPLLES